MKSSKQKKILFIYPSLYNEQNRIIRLKRAFHPSRTLPYLAALTPRYYHIRIVEEFIESINFDEDVDLIALTGMVCHMRRAIDIAREFRKRGKTVIVGGVGVFSLQNFIEESNAFDSIIVGEVDKHWENILVDFEHGQLKPKYELFDYPDLENLPPARFELLNLKKYMKSFFDHKNPLLPIETSRSCPHNCKFCLVTRYFGPKVRYRPIRDVVQEIKHYGAKDIIFTDDNILVNPSRSRELFHAIKPLGIKWFGQFECLAVKHPELLRLAAESGCHSALVGVESLLEENLYSAGKSRNIKVAFKDVVKGFKHARIRMIASLIFGMDHDTPENITWTIEEMIKYKVDMIIPLMLTPTPRTPLYEEYKGNGQIAHENYSLYDYLHAVIHPKQMSRDELINSYWKGLKRFYSFGPILRRVLQAKDRKLRLIANLYYRKRIVNGFHPFT